MIFEDAREAGAEAARALRGAARKEMAAVNADRRAAAKELAAAEHERAVDRVAVLQEDKAELQRQMQALERKPVDARDSANLARAELERFQAQNDCDVADDPENTKTQKI